VFQEPATIQFPNEYSPFGLHNLTHLVLRYLPTRHRRYSKLQPGCAIIIPVALTPPAPDLDQPHLGHYHEYNRYSAWTPETIDLPNAEDKVQTRQQYMQTVLEWVLEHSRLPTNFFVGLCR
jgi:hypothetical protein